MDNETKTTLKLAFPITNYCFAAGLVLLVLKLTAFQELSWWWVVGVGLFPWWAILAVIITALTVGLACATVYIVFMILFIWLPDKFQQKSELEKIRESYAHQKLKDDLIDKR